MPQPVAQPPTPLALAAILLAPLLLLGPSLFGSRTFVPFDIAQWPPVSTMLTPEQRAAVVHEQNADPTEIPLTFLPELRFAAQELAAGRLPEWNPFARTGVPLLATAVVGLLYPLNWVVFATADPAHGLAIGAYLGFAIAGLLMFGLLRAMRLGTWAALFGALAFQLSGTLCANVHFYQRFGALIWLPGMLWALVLLADRRGRARIPAMLALAACVVMTWLAGFPPFAAASLVVAALFGLRGILRRLALDGPLAGMRLAGCMLAAVALGTAAAAVQLVPMFAFFPESNRTVAPSSAELASAGFDPAGLLGWLLPHPFGHPHLASVEYDHSPLAFLLFSRADWDNGALFFPAFNYIEYAVYPGTLVLLLALAAALNKRQKYRRVALVALLGLVMLSFGSAWLAGVHHLPGLRNVPPKRFLGPGCALLAILAALGAEQVVGGGGRRRWWVLAGAAALTAAICGWQQAALRDTDLLGLQARWGQAIYDDFRTHGLPELTRGLVNEVIGPRMAGARQLLVDNLRYAAVAMLLASVWLALVPGLRRRRGGVAVLMLLALGGTVAQLAALGAAVSSGRRLEHPIDTPVHEFLRAQRRVHAADGGFTVARGYPLPPGTPADPAQQTTAHSAPLPWLLPPCTLVPERIRDLNIYTFVDQHSHKPIRALYGDTQLYGERWVKSLPDDDRMRAPLLDLLGVRFVLSDRPLRHSGERVGPTWRGPGGEFFVYERPTALPRAFWVPALAERLDEAAILDALVQPDFAPRAAALVSPEVAAALPAPPPGEPPATPRDVRFERDDPTAIDLAVGPGPAGYLILADSAMSGWEARIDGTPIPIHRANVAMRIVAVPAGPVEVEFRYRTPGLRTGFLITVAALLAAVALLLLWWRGRRAGATSGPQS